MTVKPMRIAIVGAEGRMGRAVIKALLTIPWLKPHIILQEAITRHISDRLGEDIGLMAGEEEIGVALSDDPVSALQNVDGVIDFSSPGNTITIAQLCAERNLVHVIGTTGFSKKDETEIRVAALNGACIVKSANMSIGINLLSIVSKIAARALPSTHWDVEIFEMHHRHKVDTPSGTALLLGQAVAEGRNISLHDNSALLRTSESGPRKEGSIGFATLRGGSVVGKHSVIMAGENETITFSHSATDRSVFANGAITAALWAHSQPPGIYSMIDVLGLRGLVPEGTEEKK
ncbi:4-hydroxy-tetrahydrodipicolinate reductase [Liberibacter crescens]|uniref:4-hydroxy-tetrahydrodipicolinate reductase n=1 Tax=Liberibacter crescens TaxID=1273132 RepID=UPI0007635E17|nr:4-hydroxy-tetrahydrodipicolinate reductase [Liberibacter crescens]